MIPLRSETVIRIVSEDAVMITKSPRRRIVFGVAALLLVITTAISLDPAVDFQGNRLFGTLFMAFLIISSVMAAGLNRSFIFDRSRNGLLKRHTFFGLTYREPVHLLPLNAVTSIHLTDLQLLRGRKHEPADQTESTRKAARSGFFESRGHLFQLSVESAEKKILIQESSYVDELEVSAGVLTAFLGVPITRTVSH